MKKKLFEYLKELGFAKSNLPVYCCFTKGTPQQCLVFPKGRLSQSTLMSTRFHLVTWGYLGNLEFDEMFIYNKDLKKSSMRTLILNRIAEFKKNNENFSVELMRWRNFKITNGEGKETHISQIKFESLSDDELLRIFELIMRKLSKVM